MIKSCCEATSQHTVVKDLKTFHCVVCNNVLYRQEGALLVSEEGGNKARYEAAKAKTDELNDQFRKEGIPSPRDCYRMNTEEFAFNVTQKALIKALKELGLDRNLWLALLHETWYAEQRAVYVAMKKLRSDELRQRLTDGIMIKPDIET